MAEWQELLGDHGMAQDGTGWHRMAQDGTGWTILWGWQEAPQP